MAKKPKKRTLSQQLSHEAAMYRRLAALREPEELDWSDVSKRSAAANRALQLGKYGVLDA